MNKQYRILIVVPGLTSRGGLASVADFLYRMLEETDQFCPDLLSIATASRDTTSVRLLRPSTWFAGVRMINQTWKGRKVRHVGANLSEFEFQRYRPRARLTRILNQYDLIQIVGGTPAWGLVAQNSSTPVALQVATLASSERTSRLRSWSSPLDVWRSLMTRVVVRLDWKALDVPDVIFVENDWMKKTISTHLDHARVVFAPPGIDVTFFDPRRRGNGVQGGSDVAKFCRQHDYLLSVGRFGDPRKNVKLLFEAYGRLRRRRENVPPLVLIGRSGPPSSAWAHAEQRSIRDKIVFFQDVSRKELALAYREARLFVLSSDEEGLGIAILEAMASGLPVISTNCGGPATSVVHEKTGLLVPVGDADALSRALPRLLDNPYAAREMGRQGRSRAVSEFSEHATRTRFVNNYLSILQA